MITRQTQATAVTIEELDRFVRFHSTVGDPDNSLADWLDGSDLDDSMTCGDVVDEWDGDREYVETVMRNGLI